MTGVTSTTAVRTYAQVTGLGDIAGRYRALRLASRHLEPNQRLLPEAPSGGGRDTERLNARHHASLILALAAPTPAGAPQAVRELETLTHDPDRVKTDWMREADPDPDVAFLYTATDHSLRGYVEAWIAELATLSPAELDHLEQRLHLEGRWTLTLTIGDEPFAAAMWTTLAHRSGGARFLGSGCGISWRPARELNPEISAATARASVPPPAPRTISTTATLSFAPIAAAARMLAAQPPTSRRSRRPTSHGNEHGTPPARGMPRPVVRSRDQGVSAPSRDVGSPNNSDIKSISMARHAVPHRDADLLQSQQGGALHHVNRRFRPPHRPDG